MSLERTVRVADSFDFVMMLEHCCGDGIESLHPYDEYLRRI
jgi:hypothetical protein